MSIRTCSYPVIFYVAIPTLARNLQCGIIALISALIQFRDHEIRLGIFAVASAMKPNMEPYRKGGIFSFCKNEIKRWKQLKNIDDEKLNLNRESEILGKWNFKLKPISS